jgi:RsiW-degrading membrane proteinase PrsW (M82 family)
MPVLLVSILWLALIIYTIKGIFERQELERNTQLLWTILIVVAPVFGLLIYYIFGTERKN